VSAPTRGLGADPRQSDLRIARGRVERGWVMIAAAIGQEMGGGGAEPRRARGKGHKQKRLAAYRVA